MLDRLGRAARALHRARRPLAAFAAACAAVLVLALLGGGGPDGRWTAAGLTGLGWSLALLCLGGLFAGTPPKAAKEDGRRRRAAVAARRAGLWALAGLFAALTLTLAWLSWHLIRLAWFA